MQKSFLYESGDYKWVVFGRDPDIPDHYNHYTIYIALETFLFGIPTHRSYFLVILVLHSFPKKSLT